ncbi:hypothetical protein CDEST_02771 [Colletotrichum destructivum]|uniref:Secreted protein n=1 Tax=Colletotrichum destructivum TaxID=34406 RepID=A0AAX4I2Z9_9PEZI|nr:hypothetical protein CDEST_02771 [Colletotrichum destructivum]
MIRTYVHCVVLHATSNPATPFFFPSSLLLIVSCHSRSVRAVSAQARKGCRSFISLARPSRVELMIRGWLLPSQCFMAFASCLACVCHTVPVGISLDHFPLELTNSIMMGNRHAIRSGSTASDWPSCRSRRPSRTRSVIRPHLRGVTRARSSRRPISHSYYAGPEENREGHTGTEKKRWKKGVRGRSSV